MGTSDFPDMYTQARGHVHIALTHSIQSYDYFKITGNFTDK